MESQLTQTRTLPQTAFSRDIQVNEFDALMFIAYLDGCIQIAADTEQTVSYNHLQRVKTQALGMLRMELHAEQSGKVADIV